MSIIEKNIEDVLIDLEVRIRDCADNPGINVTLTSDEMNILSDPDQLRILKIYKSIPADFKASDSIDDCIASIIKGDTIYRILEYCVLTNRALASVRNHVNLGENEVS